MFDADPYEFIHTLNGARFRQGTDRSKVITYTLIEKNDEVVGMKVYLDAIAIDPKTGVVHSATYILDVEEANKFRNWFMGW